MRIAGTGKQEAGYRMRRWTGSSEIDCGSIGLGNPHSTIRRLYPVSAIRNPQSEIQDGSIRFPKSEI